MKLKLVALAALTSALTVVSAPVFADQALATAKNCMACHAIDKKMVGPAYKEVAAKYSGDADAVKKLAVAIQKGSAPGKGNWGPVPMPANTQVSEAEAAKLAAWVLAQK
jgi:cytochrome c